MLFDGCPWEAFSFLRQGRFGWIWGREKVVGETEVRGRRRNCSWDIICERRINTREENKIFKAFKIYTRKIHRVYNLLKPSLVVALTPDDKWLCVLPAGNKGDLISLLPRFFHRFLCVHLVKILGVLEIGKGREAMFFFKMTYPQMLCQIFGPEW